VYPRRSVILASKYADHFRVRMLPGQTVADWVNAGPQLATTLNVSEVRVRPAAPGRWSKKPPRLVIEVTAIRRDALADTIPLPEPAEVPDLTALPVATTEDGDAYRLRLLGHHVLIGGATGAGKGSVLWSLIVSLAPGVRSGLVRLYGIDPKSLEFPYGAGLFNEVIDGQAAAMADALEHFVEVMERRKAQMRGVSRLHVPTVEEPLIVVIVDELAALTAYTTDKEAKKRIDGALALLLSQGRAMAISVVAAAQDPRKEVLGQRALFTTRIGMRLNEAADADMLLGSGARARGALCDRIAIIQEGRIRALGTMDELRAEAEAGAAGLEDVFLKLTGGEAVAELVASLRVVAEG
jgi:S-DNA-T family DNA segregation ATPase FtsK/SpoIIIE